MLYCFSMPGSTASENVSACPLLPEKESGSSECRPSPWNASSTISTNSASLGSLSDIKLYSYPTQGRNGFVFFADTSQKKLIINDPSLAAPPVLAQPCSNDRAAPA